MNIIPTFQTEANLSGNVVFEKLPFFDILGLELLADFLKAPISVSGLIFEPKSHLNSLTFENQIAIRVF